MENSVLDCSRRSPSFLEKYLQAVEAVRIDDPKEALEMAETGLHLATRISEDVYGYAACQLVIAKAWGALGGTLRAVNRFDEAEWAYRTAANYLRWANADKIERALLCRRLAFLRSDQGRYAESRQLLNNTIDCYRSEHQTSLLGQALADMGRTILLENEDPRSAERYLLRALDYLPREEEAYLLSTRFSLLNLYCEHDGLGDPQELLGLVRQLKQHPLCSESSPVEAHVLLLEGLALNRTGTPVEAAQLLDQARQLFLHHSNHLSAAVAAMELALVWLQLGLHDKCQRLAGKLFPIYKFLKKDREAAAALTLFIRTASTGHLDSAITRKALQCLQARAKMS